MQRQWLQRPLQKSLYRFLHGLDVLMSPAVVRKRRIDVTAEIGGHLRIPAANDEHTVGALRTGEKTSLKHHIIAGGRELSLLIVLVSRADSRCPRKGIVGGEEKDASRGAPGGFLDFLQNRAPLPEVLGPIEHRCAAILSFDELLDGCGGRF